MPSFDRFTLTVYVLLVLPGILSMKIFALIHPVERRNAGEQVLDALAFGMLNASVIFAALSLGPSFGLGRTISEFLQLIVMEPCAVFILVLVALVIAPGLWAIGARGLLLRLARKGWILRPYHSAFDAVFARGEPLFVVVHLRDGRRVAGLYGTESFAGLHPHSGHLYLEQLWSIDDQGRIGGPIPGSKGVIVRPDDYIVVEIIAPEKTDGNEGGRMEGR